MSPEEQPTNNVTFDESYILFDNNGTRSGTFTFPKFVSDNERASYGLLDPVAWLFARIFIVCLPDGIIGTDLLVQDRFRYLFPHCLSSFRGIV